MRIDGWKLRLEAAVAESRRSRRDISLAAGLGPGYLHSILKEGKDPGVERLALICDVLNVSMAHILYGLDITPEDEQILGAVQGSPHRRAAVLTLLDGKA